MFSAREQLVYDMIEDHFSDSGQTPNVCDLSRNTGLSYETILSSYLAKIRVHQNETPI